MTGFPTRHRLAEAGTIAITIDDGPNPDTTLALLDVLAVHGAKANFFVLGANLAAFPDLAARIVADGHGLFSHGFDHTALTELDAPAIFDQLARTETLLQSWRPAGAPPLLRFPFGAGVDVALVRNAVAAWNPDAVAIQWSLCAEEWNLIGDCHTPSQVQQVTQAAVRRLAASEDWDGAIVLMHDWPSVPADKSPPKPLAAAFCASLLEQYLIQAARFGLEPVVLR